MMRADIAVVGAGIVGCMVAHEMVRRAPEASVVVLDRDSIGCGASRRSAGLHFPRGATDRVRYMSAYSQDYYEQLKRTRPWLPIRALGMAIVAPLTSAAHLRELYLGRARLKRADHVPGELVRVPDGAGVWHGEGCQYADVHALAQSLACELRPRVSIREGVSVVAVDSADGAVTVHFGSGEALTADQVVLAPGPWLTAPAWKALVAPLGARVKKVVALHIELCPAAEDGAIIFQEEDAFLLPLHDRGHWLFSYTCREWDVDPDAPVGGLSPRNVEEARDVLGRYAPELAARCTAGRVFCDAYSRSGEPQVEPLDPDRRIVFAGAANGSGYRLAPAIAAEAADLLHTSFQVRSYA